MKRKAKESYVQTKKPDGNDVYCPVDSEDIESAQRVEDAENCVEKDVVERYSGNIDIKK